VIPISESPLSDLGPVSEQKKKKKNLASVQESNVKFGRTAQMAHPPASTAE